MKWFMNIIDFMYARPYLAKGAVVPERSGIRYAYHVGVGTKFWIHHEMSLWKAWAAWLSSILLIVILSILLGENSPYVIEWIVLIPAMLAFTITFFVVLFASVTRFGEWAFRTPGRALGSGAIVLALLGYHVYRHPDIALRAWNEMSWLIYVVGAMWVILIVTVVIVEILVFFKKRKARS